jgi:hypothetical protein
MQMTVNTDAPGITTLTSEVGAPILVDAVLNRDGWSDKEGLTIEREAAFRLALDYDSGLFSKAPGAYYTLLVKPNTDSTDAGLAGTGYLTVTVDKKGKVKTAGKLADGTSVSMSSVVQLKAAEPTLVLFNAPRTYSGGCFLAGLTFSREALAPGRVLLNGSAQWENRNPRATSGGDFSFALDVQGGWYSKKDTLKKMFNNDDGLVASALDWHIDAAFNAKGTGLNALPACKKNPLSNPACLKLSVKPKTGLFSGSFIEEVGGKSVTRKMQGVLTPALTDADGLTGIAGAGYFLIPQTVPFKFNQSGDFMLEPDCGCGD